MAQTPQTDSAEGVRRLHEEAYAVALVVRALCCCVPTFAVKQKYMVLFECLRFVFSRKKTSGYQRVSIFKLFWASRQLYIRDR